MRLLNVCLKLGMSRKEASKMLQAISIANNPDLDRAIIFMNGMKQGQRIEREYWMNRMREHQYENV